MTTALPSVTLRYERAFGAWGSAALRDRHAEQGYKIGVGYCLSWACLQYTYHEGNGFSFLGTFLPSLRVPDRARKPEIVMWCWFSDSC